MNKHILSIALLAAIPGIVFAETLPRPQMPPYKPVLVKKNELTVAVGQEFEIPLSSKKDRFHDEWHFSSIELLEDQKEDHEIGLELISQTYTREVILPVDEFWQRANCTLICKFTASKAGSYKVIFSTGKVKACSYFPETLEIIVHVYHDWCGTESRMRL